MENISKNDYVSFLPSSDLMQITDETKTHYICRLFPCGARYINKKTRLFKRDPPHNETKTQLANYAFIKESNQLDKQIYGKEKIQYDFFF